MSGSDCFAAGAARRGARAVCAGALAVLLLPVVPAVAQDPVRETVVVTGALQPLPFESLARTVHILSREQIAALPVHSVAELLQEVAGLDVRSRGGMGVQADLSVRGSLFEQVLVLVNGVRVKNAQTGHHTADLPVALQDIERVEVLSGAGSSLYGADAFGGTINIITRRPAAGGRASLAAGSHRFVEGSVSYGMEQGAYRQTLSAWGNRSSGFTYDRGFRTVGASTSIEVGEKTRLSVAHVSRAFGAAGFYGPSPSYEWTNHTLATAERELATQGGWDGTVQASYRTHADEFLWDIEQPDRFRNQHRTHALAGLVKMGRSLRPGTRLTVGGETAGDWIVSSSLGHHAVPRAGAFAEVQQLVGQRLFLYPGLRYDRYGTFGGAWSPSLSSAWIASEVLKVRASAGRAFRVPTFTERFYRDPNHLASADLEPETAWSAEAGADIGPSRGWVLAVTGFARRERGVIDWTRRQATDVWRTTNIHRVWARGAEVGARRAWGGRAELRVTYALTDIRLDGVPGLSKYVADFARHSLSVSTTAPLPARVSAGARVAFKRRDDGRQYSLADLRFSRPLAGGRLVAFVEGTNLFDTRYEEVRGVAMPGRAFQAGLVVPAF